MSLIIESIADEEYVWVDKNSGIDEAKSAIENSSIVCLDTEYDSFRYFREKLCLMQIRAGSDTYLFDPLNAPDISFLGGVFSDSRVVKVVHAGDNDIRILKRDYGFEFKNVFDTQRAASILGCLYLSLEAVVLEYLGVDMKKAKKMQRSCWEEQIRYAVRDTRYLSDLYLKLKSDIAQKGLEAEAQKAFGEMCAVEWREKVLDSSGYLKIKGAGDMDMRQIKRLKKLFGWRFKKAKEINMARFMVLSDHDMINLAESGINSTESLEKSGVLSSGKMKKFGREIVDILKGI
jgi:ribonuclease D